MITKTLTLLLLCAATLTQAAAPRSDFPCPEAADILPCVCEQVDVDLNLDCSKIVDDADLQRVFNVNFPFPDFTNFTMIANPEEPRINVINLNENIFQNISFSSIIISHTNLELIHPFAFDKSAPRLKTLIVSDSALLLFPFDLVNYAPLLTDLRVFRNKLVHMPEMFSDSLKYLQISYNPGLEYGDHALRALPNLEHFVANDIELSHVGVNAFWNNTMLKYVDLSFNNLETLYAGTLNFSSPIEVLNLDNNNIVAVEVGAISGLGAGASTELSMHNNGLTELTQTVWEPVFDSVVGTTRLFTFDGNPISCDCSILWLVSNDDHKNTITRGTKCAETDTDILDVDSDFLLNQCGRK